MTGNSLEQIGHRSWDTSFFNGGTEGEREEMGTVWGRSVCGADLVFSSIAGEVLEGWLHGIL